jgi:hypothetical protein
MAATPASMLRIVSEGLQDIERLNTFKGQPSVQFYSSVLKRRTRWASQWKRVEFDNLADFGRKATVTLPILGELITRATLVVELPDLYTPQHAAIDAGGPVTPQWSWTNGIGHALCSEIDFQIGGQIVDRLDSRLLEVIDEQTRPVEHFDSTNTMIARDPATYSDIAYSGETPTQTRLQAIELVPPFWWNRGPGPQALPIQALYKDKVQINVTFRPVQQCVYTSTRTEDNPLLPGVPGPLPTFAGCPFLNAAGELTGQAMPASWHFRDAYWIVEYVSLEDREAAAFRMADLQIPIEQHVAVPVQRTEGARQIRIPLNQGGLVRDMTWVAQRVEAPTYNAHFLFSRDLSDNATPLAPWWPDTQVPNWDYGDGYIRPGFSDRRSDPISAATFWTRGVRRFEHEGPSFFRSLIPALGSRRCPLIDRYIYRYDFGLWPTGGLAEALDLSVDEVRGAANWDKLPQKELALTMNLDDCARAAWELLSAATRQYDAPIIGYIDADFPSTTEGFQVTLVGARPNNNPNNGFGSYINCKIDYQQIRRLPGFTHLLIRSVGNGSTALVAECIRDLVPVYVWLAVAGAGGYGSDDGAGRGGDAANAVEISWQGGNGSQTHAAVGGLGGGGGGRISTDPPGPGLPDGGGTFPTNNPAFVLNAALSNGGSTDPYAGGDGYYGGGSGTVAGGGGGSYVSHWVSDVSTQGAFVADNAYGVVIPLKRVPVQQPDFNIHVWLTRYNLLRIVGGRGALMFSD